MFFILYKLCRCYYPLIIFQSERSQNKQTKKNLVYLLGGFYSQAYRRGDLRNKAMLISLKHTSKETSPWVQNTCGSRASLSLHRVKALLVLTHRKAVEFRSPKCREESWTKPPCLQHLTSRRHKPHKCLVVVLIMKMF